MAEGVLLFIHGGGWISGSEKDSNNNIFKSLGISVGVAKENLNGNFVKFFNSKGYSCITMKYSLVNYINKINANITNNPAITPGNLIHIQEINQVVNWIITHNTISGFTFNNKNISIIGESAGGYYTLMYALQNLYNIPSTSPFKKIKSIVSLYAPTDFSLIGNGNNYSTGQMDINMKLPMKLSANNTPTNLSRLFISNSNSQYEGLYASNGLLAYFGIRAFDAMIQKGENPTSTIRRQFSPISFLDTENPALLPPIFLIHGANDVVIPYKQFELLYNKLSVGTSIHKYFRHDNTGHGLAPTGIFANNDGLIDIIRGGQPLLNYNNSILAWLNSKMY